MGGLHNGRSVFSSTSGRSSQWAVFRTGGWLVFSSTGGLLLGMRGTPSPKLGFSKVGETGAGSRTYPSVALQFLILLNFSKTLCSHVLPMLLLLECVLNLNLGLIDPSETGVDFPSLHLLLMVSGSGE